MGKTLAWLGHRRKWSIFHKGSVVGVTAYIIWSALSKMKVWGPLLKKLLWLSRWQQQSIKPSSGHFWTQDALQLHRSRIHEAGLGVRKRWKWLENRKKLKWVSQSEFLTFTKRRMMGDGVKEKGRCPIVQNPADHWKELELGRNIVLIFAWLEL